MTSKTAKVVSRLIKSFCQCKLLRQPASALFVPQSQPMLLPLLLKKSAISAVLNILSFKRPLDVRPQL